VFELREITSGPESELMENTSGATYGGKKTVTLSSELELRAEISAGSSKDEFSTTVEDDDDDSDDAADDEDDEDDEDVDVNDDDDEDEDESDDDDESERCGAE